jgi:hypothetical protein
MERINGLILFIAFTAYLPLRRRPPYVKFPVITDT